MSNDDPARRSITELIAERANSTPAFPAVVEDGERLTYGALDAQASLLAHRLRALGAGRERIVALVLPRSGDLVVAALATVRAGAAYAPFDPATPAERLAAMLEDAEPGVVVTRATYGPRLTSRAWATVMLDSEAEGPIQPTAAPERNEPRSWPCSTGA